MLTYEQINNWWKQKENKNKVVLGVSFVLIFLVGFGTGGYEREVRRDGLKPQTNYTTIQSKKPAVNAVATGETTQAAAGKVAGAATDATCIVKGNISTAGKKIYHIQGGAFYKIVKPEQCFNTEGEAQAAGFVKSSR